MKIIALLIIPLFATLQAVSQTLPPQMPHGTLLYAGIYTDGILIAADSRSSIHKGLDTAGHEIYFAYIDSIRKIFPLGKFQILITGNSSLKHISFNYSFSEFNKKVKPDSTVQSTFESYIKFVQKKLKVDKEELNKTSFIVAGYQNGNPVILLSDSGRISITSEPFIRFVSYSKAADYLPFMTAQCSQHTSMILEMFRLASIDNFGIGGPVNIIQIRPDNSLLSLNEFKYAKIYDKDIDWYKAVYNNEIPIVYRYPILKEEYLNGIKVLLKCKCYRE